MEQHLLYYQFVLFAADTDQIQGQSLPSGLRQIFLDPNTILIDRMVVLPSKDRNCPHANFLPPIRRRLASKNQRHRPAKY